MDKKRSYEKSSSVSSKSGDEDGAALSTASPLASSSAEHDDSVQENRLCIYATPLHLMCTEETDELDSTEHCSSRKKPKMDVDYLPLYTPAVSLSAGTPISAMLSSEESSNSSGLTTSSSADSSYLNSPSSPVDESSASGDTIRPARVLQELNHESSSSSSATSHYHMQVRTIALPQPEPIIPAMPAVLKRFNDAEDIWKSMLKKEACYERSSSYLTKHRDLQYRMRSLLVDWLMEVCEEYKLKRSTLYLACEHLDRYMAKSRDVPKTRLQLIGVTALHIAAKNEEIYPPKLTTLVELTDGACTEREVVHQEMLMLHKLKWMLSPVTPVMWINFYVQVYDHYWSTHRVSSNSIPEPESTLNSCISLHVKTDFKELMVKISRLLDICLYDIEHLEFRPSVLAATAFYHCMGLANTTVVSGYTKEDLSLCVRWMKPFANSYRADACSKESIKFRGEDDYQVHTHATNLSNLDHAMEVRERLNRARFESPVNVGGVITPPLSGHK